MGYQIINGKVVRLRLPKKPRYSREPITTPFKHELFHSGPVRDMAWAIAKVQLFKEIRAEGKDPNLASSKQISDGITILLRNAGEYYLNKAKEALR